MATQLVVCPVTCNFTMLGLWSHCDPMAWQLVMWVVELLFLVVALTLCVHCYLAYIVLLGVR